MSVKGDILVTASLGFTLSLLNELPFLWLCLVGLGFGFGLEEWTRPLGLPPTHNPPPSVSLVAGITSMFVYTWQVGFS